jgi:hypothetical protein
MVRADVNERSPLRVLESTIDGGVGPGELGVVLARPGVGKTAFLVQVGLDCALRERRVLHVGIGDTVPEVRSWYDEMFVDLAAARQLEDRSAAQLLIERHRMIQTYDAEAFTSSKLGAVLEILATHAAFVPDVLLIDGLAWESTTPATLQAFKALAAQHGCALWATARGAQDDDEVGEGLPAPLTGLVADLDVVIYLRPGSNHIDLRLLLDHGVAGAESTPLALHPDTMMLVDHRETGDFVAASIPPEQYTLYSGAAPGAEATFGELAEHYGLSEVNYTFEGHNPARGRGLTELAERKLRQGDVSLSYVAKRMNRTFTTSPTFRKVLQSIWHQINSAQQVIVVGLIKDDGTVKGGTGWGAELARVWNKPLWVFDQDKEQWFRWNSLDEKWVPSRTPRLIAANFAGTGTRFLTDAGTAAIREIFETTFGG